VGSIDLVGRFRGSRIFVEEAEKAFPEFYAKVSQRLTQWIPKAPKVKEPKVETIADVVPDAEDIGTEFQAMAVESAEQIEATKPGD
jgi:hypothetical protein